MSKLQLFDIKGAPAGDYDLPDNLMELEKGEQAVKDVVVAIMAANRAGTASTLGKGEVAGSNKKLWKQKGTGRARTGLRQSPVWRGGGVAHGPKPRSYAKKVNKKVAKLAFRRAMSERIKDNEVVVIDNLSFDAPKTKDFIEVLKGLGVGAKALFVMGEVDYNVALSARNLQGICLVKAADLDVYTLLKYPKVVVDKAGMEVIASRMNTGKGDSK